MKQPRYAELPADRETATLTAEIEPPASICSGVPLRIAAVM
ncbi:hypothetical protein [Nonomuraea solani]|nr:hypothetical protein [Nonomuraea solani]